jgi:hypothetical protein
MCDCGRVVTGPNTVVMPETGNGHNCDCSAPQFLIDGAKNDNRLVSMFGQGDVSAKLDSLVRVVCVLDFLLFFFFDECRPVSSSHVHVFSLLLPCTALITYVCVRFSLRHISSVRAHPTE